MSRPAALTALAALLLATGCTAAHSHPPVGPQASRPGTVSIAPAGKPAGATATRPSTTAPTTTEPASTSAPASTAPASTAPASSSAAPAASRPAGPSSTATPGPGTELVVRRPVTAHGRAAAGYTVVALEPDDQLNCGGSLRGLFPSPVAVDPGIVGCTPSAEYALACWQGPTTTTALCYQDPWQRRVVEIHTGGRLAAQPVPRQPSPLGLVLGNGVRCTLRDGGAWGTLDGHPDMFGTFSCTDRSVIWGTDHSDGIDRASTLWKAWLAPGSGHGNLHPMTVRTAYFVGTARS
ncbi:MAG: hypothetical protein JO144_11175 [Actinobacteria bacterium]|nr:hypothetical protein [Actinomycetota bacterium]